MKKFIIIAILAIYIAVIYYAFFVSENEYVNAFIVPFASVCAVVLLDHFTDKQTAKSK